MADAICGPSNALQSFQKHSTVDRTLQQDRLRTNTPLGQGFRSADPRTPALDADFAAFEAGQSFQPHAQQPLFPQAAHPVPLSPAQLQVQSNPVASWATDFQKLRLSGPNQPLPQSQFRAEAPLHRPQAGSSGWHAEFMKQQQSRQSPGLAVTAQQSYPGLQYGMNTSMPLAYDGFGQNQFVQPAQVHDGFQNINQQEMATMDDAAFEEAFAQAESEQIDHQVESTVDESVRLGKQKADAPVEENILPSEPTVRIGSDLIPEREAPTTEAGNKAEADELARTAADLLDALKHDQSEKFQNSQFLSLMRRIRDREVEVQGDDLKETQESPKELRDMAEYYQPLHPGGPYYPYPSRKRIPEQLRMSGGIDTTDFDDLGQTSRLSTIDSRIVSNQLRQNGTGTHSHGDVPEEHRQEHQSPA